MPSSTFGVASSSKVWAISSAVICRCVSTVDMWLLLKLSHVIDSRHSGAAEVPIPESRGSTMRNCALGVRRLRIARNDGRRLFHRLDAIPVGLAIAEGLERNVLQH